jgi:multidrug efflux system membrane fusion protein
MDHPAVPPPPSAAPPPAPAPDPKKEEAALPAAARPRTPDEWRKPAARILGVLVIAGACALTLAVWRINERHPRTDDAIARANVVGIAPRVRGQIVRLNVRDNQLVAAGDVLFEIDPDDYALVLEKAKAALAALDQQIEVARAQDSDIKYQVKVAEAGVDRAQAELKQADDTLQRLQPLLPDGFARADEVDRVATAKHVASAALAAEKQRVNQARTTLSALATLTAQRPGAVATVDLAALELSYCKVVAPFPGRVINLNISQGAFASAGIPVFSLLDTRQWYVTANFREGELRHIAPGHRADVYLSSAPDRRFKGRVQGIGWAVEPTDAIDLPHGLPLVKRELNWVHVAQRFPVRIEIEDPDPDLFRMGISAVAIIRGPDGEDGEQQASDRQP